MDTINVLIPLIVVGAIVLFSKITWMSGSVAGSMQETKRWLDAFDKLRVPNWQCSPITEGDKNFTPEQSKIANQVFVAAYAVALDRIKTEIADLRRDALEKMKAKEARHV